MPNNLYEKEQAARQEGCQAKEARQARDNDGKRNAAREDAQRKLHDTWNVFHEEVEPTAAAKAKRDDEEQRYLNTIRDNPSLASGSLIDQLSKLLMVTLGYGSALVLDFFVMSSTATYFLSMVSSDPSRLHLLLAKLLLPLTFVAFEAVIATRRFRARERADRVMAALWTGAGCIWILVVIFIAQSTYVAAQYWEGASRLELVWMITLGLAFVAASALPHVVILLSGEDAHQGKAYISMRLRRRKVVRLDRRYRDCGKKVLAAFRDAMHASHKFKRTFGISPETPIFTEGAREVINDLLGREVIPPSPAPRFSDSASGGNEAV